MGLHGRPVAALDRTGQLEAVLDRAAHQRLQRLGRRACRGDQACSCLVQRDQVVRRDRGPRVVERPLGVGELERLQPEQARQLEPELERLVRLGGDRRPGTVELLGPSRACERLQGMD